MATTANFNQSSAPQMAKGGEFHDQQKYQLNNSGANRKRAITSEQKQRIRELYAAGKTGHEIARMMGLGSTTVYNYLQLGTKKPRWSDWEDQIVIDGYAKKLPIKEIANKIGRSEQAVILHMHWHRKKVRGDPKKRRALSAITMAFRAVRKADIFREVTE